MNHCFSCVTHNYRLKVRGVGEEEVWEQVLGCLRNPWYFG